MCYKSFKVLLVLLIYTNPIKQGYTEITKVGIYGMIKKKDGLRDICQNGVRVGYFD